MNTPRFPLTPPSFRRQLAYTPTAGPIRNLKPTGKCARARWCNAVALSAAAMLMAGTGAMAQTARVAPNSIKFHPDLENKQLALEFRLVEHLAVTAVQALAADNETPMPAKWNVWATNKAPACTWMIVVDTGNSARPKTVTNYVDFVRAFLACLPPQDKAAVYTLTQNLTEVVPIDSTPDERAKALAAVKVAGGSASPSLIFSTLREGLAKLEGHKDSRLAVLLLTSGQDQTPGGPDEQELARTKLIETANNANIALHTLACAESVGGKKYFLPLKEISAQTDGLFEVPALDGAELPFGTMFRLRGAMHGTGIIHIDLSTMASAAPLTVTVKTANGRVANIEVPAETVAQALTPPAADKPTKPDTITHNQEPAITADDATQAETAKIAEQIARQAAADKLAKQEAEDDAQATKAAQAATSKPQAPAPAPQPKSHAWMLVVAGAVLLVIILLLVVFLRKRHM